jgi:hypothetical protein
MSNLVLAFDFNNVSHNILPILDILIVMKPDFSIPTIPDAPMPHKTQKVIG